MLRMPKSGMRCETDLPKITPKSHLIIIPLLQPAKQFGHSVEPNQGKPRRIEPNLAEDCRGQKQVTYFLFWFSVPRLSRQDSWGSKGDFFLRARSFGRHAGHPIWVLISGNSARSGLTLAPKGSSCFLTDYGQDRKTLNIYGIDKGMIHVDMDYLVKML